LHFVESITSLMTDEQNLRMNKLLCAQRNNNIYKIKITRFVPKQNIIIIKLVRYDSI